MRGAKTPDAYREGSEGRQIWQGESLAMDAAPLVLRWGIGYEASDELSGCSNQVSLLKRLSRMTGNCHVRF